VKNQAGDDSTVMPSPFARRGRSWPQLAVFALLAL